MGFCIFVFLTSFAELFGGNQAVDRVRGQQVPGAGPTLDYLGEQLRYDSVAEAEFAYQCAMFFDTPPRRRGVHVRKLDRKSFSAGRVLHLEAHCWGLYRCASTRSRRRIC